MAITAEQAIQDMREALNRVMAGKPVTLVVSGNHWAAAQAVYASLRTDLQALLVLVREDQEVLSHLSRLGFTRVLDQAGEYYHAVDPTGPGIVSLSHDDSGNWAWPTAMADSIQVQVFDGLGDVVDVRDYASVRAYVDAVDAAAQVGLKTLFP